jgi:thiol:disulfide interchange protein DsbA
MNGSYWPRILLFWLAACLVLPATAEDYEEGIDYQRVPTKGVAYPGGKVEVVEFFWYGCPHCWSLEPVLEEWKPSLPEGVIFERVPAPINDRWAFHARVFYALQAMGVLDELHRALFEAIHEKRQRLFDRDAVAKFVAAHGVDEKTFLSTMDSFAVDAKVRQAETLTRRYGISGVPTLVVNGKYKTGPTLATSNARAVAVVDYLVDRELAAKPADTESVSLAP